MGNVPVVSPTWITESVSKAKLLDCSKYLLYTKHTHSQPKLNFNIVDKPLDEVINKSTVGSSVECNNGSNVATVHNKKTITAADPKFLSEFYNNSRLHLISTLGAEYKQMVNNWRENTPRNFPGRTKLLQKHPGYYAFLLMGWQESNFGLHQQIALCLFLYSFVNVRISFS